MHFPLPPPHSSTFLCPRNPHAVSWTGMSERSSSLLSRFTGWQWLLVRHRSAQRGHSYNTAAECREMLSPFIVKGSVLVGVKASVYHPQRRNTPVLVWAECAALSSPSLPRMWQRPAAFCLLGLWEHSRTGHLGIMYYLESTLTKITDWTGALWYVCPTSRVQVLYLPSFPDLYLSLRSDF